jgi:glycosyltransferase involved in cell wall biosynthesis
MKILMVLNTPAAGGADVLARDLALGLTDLGATCAIVSLHGPPADSSVGGIPVHALTGPVAMKRLPLAMCRLFISCIRDRPDIVHSHGEAPDLLCRVVCGILGLPLVVTAHTERPWHWRPRLGRMLERCGVRFTSWYVAVSDAVADAYKRSCDVPESKMSVIANWACIPPTTAPDSADDMPPTGAPTIINVARLHVQKDHDTLLESFRLVKKVWPKALLWIAGTGPEEERLRQTAGEGVLFLGHRTDVRKLLRRSDLFVLSSIWEGQPLSMLEAMAEAVPIVATRVGGVPEIVQSGVNGLLVPPGDPHTLSRAILTCLEDLPRARAMGVIARERIGNGREQALREYRETYDRIITPPTTRQRRWAGTRR